jgi:hypothetical protein
MFGLTGVVHAGKSFGEPLISTRQSRQPPYGVKPSSEQIVGIVMPFALAAFRIVVPSGTDISTPSILILRGFGTVTFILPPHAF